ncbi:MULTISPECIES: 4-(cytidine 5'-diphospho)-2-C-methyl-D-erythritol kinase [Rhizobium]|nr:MULTISPECIES: 4-(cytidine 5'-diphospho)-2-C-methyl-D-erythritol kinase [Rhizobium]MCA0800805.1 4-(cytidine 5'-diphospho)-2-C-methyl-D-erythritol kinase [Rhizobium sp. T1473]MCS0458211.1 4-(cytidine 5'-diphospho)-2-C-methyl-D-erythritol kinase [Rhizobium favelukesii]UFS81694.1 4-(cytidine 5'-diphospho)-2-C-methyl-D-erythritol kinase [Rhizobium sp. T136]
MPEASMGDDLTVIEDAPAKINLALHVTGQRSDGYHLLDMLVTFTRHGDRLEFTPAERDEFVISGRFAEALVDDRHDNLVLKARDFLRSAISHESGIAPAVRIDLQKNLPIASGIGGGSADAAATLRGLTRLWNVSLPNATIEAVALRLGADVPMCLASRPLIARGIGEQIIPVDDMPAFAMVLANPLKGISTPEVFRRLTSKTNPALDMTLRSTWIETIGSMRNDLEPVARDLLPEIAEISAMLKKQGASLVRMSGSGATCYGIFDTRVAAETAAAALHSERQDWYFEATETTAGGHDARAG